MRRLSTVYSVMKTYENLFAIWNLKLLPRHWSHQWPYPQSSACRTLGVGVCDVIRRMHRRVVWEIRMPITEFSCNSWSMYLLDLHSIGSQVGQAPSFNNLFDQEAEIAAPLQ